MTLPETCQGCGHPTGRHVVCLDGKVRCFQIEDNVSTGIIMRWTSMCDCVEYRSESVERKAAEKKRTEDEWCKEMDAQLAEFLKQKEGKVDA